MTKRQHAVNTRGARKTRSREGDAWSGFAIRVLRLAGMLTAAGDALARPAGQSSARWQVLAAADHAPSTVAQMARLLGLTRQSVQRVADLLDREGLASYAENPDDLRAQRLQLTSRGKAALAAIQEAQRGWADGLGARVGRRDLDRTNVVLDRALAALTSADEGGDGKADQRG